MSRAVPLRQRSIFFTVAALDIVVDLLTAVSLVVIMEQRGLTPSAIFALIAFAWIAEGLFEIPTGVVADRFGRAQSIAASFAIRAVAYFVMWKAGSMAAFGLAFALDSVGVTLASGAIQAWGVDNAQGTDSDERFFTTYQVIELAATAGGYVIGAALAIWSTSILFLVNGAVAIAGLALALAFMIGTEGAVRRSAKEPLFTGSVVRTAFRQLSAPGIRAWSAGAALFAALATVPGAQWAAHYVEEQGFLLPGIYRATAVAVIAVLNALVAARVASALSRGPLLVLAGVITGLSLGLAGIAPAAVSLGLFGIYLAIESFVQVRFRISVNSGLSSDARATGLSIVSLAGGGLSFPIVLMLGSVTDEVGITSTTWPVAGAAMAVLLLAVGVSVARSRAEGDTTI